MKTIKTDQIEPVFVEYIPEKLEENKIYISEKYNIAVHLCICGCKNKTVTPLGGGKNWEIIKFNYKTISLIGSIGNFKFPCKSHYVITKNVVNFV